MSVKQPVTLASSTNPPVTRSGAAASSNLPWINDLYASVWENDHNTTLPEGGASNPFTTLVTSGLSNRHTTAAPLDFSNSREHDSSKSGEPVRNSHQSGHASLTSSENDRQAHLGHNVITGDKNRPITSHTHNMQFFISGDQTQRSGSNLARSSHKPEMWDQRNDHKTHSGGPSSIRDYQPFKCSDSHFLHSSIHTSSRSLPTMSNKDTPSTQLINQKPPENLDHISQGHVQHGNAFNQQHLNSQYRNSIIPFTNLLSKDCKHHTNLTPDLNQYTPNNRHFNSYLTHENTRSDMCVSTSPTAPFPFSASPQPRRSPHPMAQATQARHVSSPSVNGADLSASVQYSMANVQHERSINPHSITTHTLHSSFNNCPPNAQNPRTLDINDGTLNNIHHHSPRQFSLTHTAPIPAFNIQYNDQLPHSTTAVTHACHNPGTYQNQKLRQVGIPVSSHPDHVTLSSRDDIGSRIYDGHFNQPPTNLNDKQYVVEDARPISVSSNESSAAGNVTPRSLNNLATVNNDTPVSHDDLSPNIRRRNVIEMLSEDLAQRHAAFQRNRTPNCARHDDDSFIKNSKYAGRTSVRNNFDCEELNPSVDTTNIPRQSRHDGYTSRTNAHQRHTDTSFQSSNPSRAGQQDINARRTAAAHVSQKASQDKVVSPDGKTTKYAKSGRRPKSATNLPPCRVCGHKASGLHFGVNTCEACNEFFRRSLKRGASYYCSKNLTCKIWGKKRSPCSFCRYRRCLEVGMSRNAIKTGRYSHKIRAEYAREIERNHKQDSIEKEVNDVLGMVASLVEHHNRYIRTSSYIPKEDMLLRQMRFLEIYEEEQRRNAERKLNPSSNLENGVSDDIPEVYSTGPQSVARSELSCGEGDRECQESTPDLLTLKDQVEWRLEDGLTLNAVNAAYDMTEPIKQSLDDCDPLDHIGQIISAFSGGNRAELLKDTPTKQVKSDSEKENENNSDVKNDENNMNREAVSQVNIDSTELCNRNNVGTLTLLGNDINNVADHNTQSSKSVTLNSPYRNIQMDLRETNLKSQIHPETLKTESDNITSPMKIDETETTASTDESIIQLSTHSNPTLTEDTNKSPSEESDVVKDVQEPTPILREKLTPNPHHQDDNLHNQYLHATDFGNITSNTQPQVANHEDKDINTQDVNPTHTSDQLCNHEDANMHDQDVNTTQAGNQTCNRQYDNPTHTTDQTCNGEDDSTTVSNKNPLHSEDPAFVESHITERWIRRYINFAKLIPGFKQIPLSDQANLIRSTWYEFWFLGAYRGFNADLKVVTYPIGHSLHASQFEEAFGEDLSEQTFLMAGRMEQLQLSPDELVLMKTICLVSPDRCELTDRQSVERIHWTMVSAMIRLLQANRPGQKSLFPRIVAKMVELRTLSNVADEAHGGALFRDIIPQRPLLGEMLKHVYNNYTSAGGK